VKATKVQSTEGDIMNVTEAAKYLRVSESIIRRLVKQTRIPYFKIEGRYLFNKLKLVEWISTLTINPSCPDSGSQAEKLADKIWEKKERKI
jgi:excisionase family DNA binding protein